MELLYLLSGVLIGGISVWLISKYKYKNADNKSSENLSEIILKKEIAEERNKSLLNDLDQIRIEFSSERENNSELNKQLATKEADYKNLLQKINEQEKNITRIQDKFSVEFKNLANEILEEKTKKFTEQNKDNLDEILKPLNEKIKDFEKKVDDTYEKGLKDQTNLQAELKKLHELNYKISEEANNLTRALKGDVKKMGNWGEVILERILERSGLTKGIEYETQYQTTNIEGKKIQPDVIIHLPDKKHIIVDAKVSLLAYESYINSDINEEKEKYSKAHIKSIRNHIKELSDKHYESSADLNTPDFVLLFIPIEASFSFAVQSDQEMFNYAWSFKIVIVSPSTLLATLLTISSIWKQKNQTKNALEIADQSGKLLEKFYGFVEDLKKLGKKLAEAQSSYDDSWKKLKSGPGNLIKKSEDIKKLGIVTKKSLPDELSEQNTED